MDLCRYTHKLYGMQLDTRGKYHPAHLTVSEAWVVPVPINQEMIINHRVPYPIIKYIFLQ